MRGGKLSWGDVAVRPRGVVGAAVYASRLGPSPPKWRLWLQKRNDGLALEALRGGPEENGREKREGIFVFVRGPSKVAVTR